ncbi:MAG: FAD:protein FMN transferase [Dehalococcoidia bacterium]
MKHEFFATGTTWWLRSEGAPAGLMALVEQLVREYEARLSRFRPDSALSRLNRERRCEDDVVASVLASAESLRRLTRGAFDARAGAAVVAAGYDRPFDAIEDAIEASADPIPNMQRPTVLLSGPSVLLLGHGRVDLGGIAKGWIVDRAAELLAEAGPCIVDGGGDMRTAGGQDEWAIGVGDGLAIGLTDGAVATSSTLRRRWRTERGAAHHIVEPHRGWSSDEAVTTAVVLARDAMTADALATAVVANATNGMRAVRASGGELLLQRAGTWEMTTGMTRYLR